MKGGPLMDQGNNVQDENLVNDQVTQALADSGVADAPADDAAAPAAEPTVPTEPVVAPVPDAVVEPEAAPAEAEAADTGTAEATPVNAETVSAPLVDEPEDEPALPEVAVDEPADETPAIVGSSSPLGGGESDDALMSVKQQALEQLSPLVDHLDLPPEQKFDTYMEILRASDDKALVQPAFEEAQKIEDEDKKAQALLDVVNEVNYLTQDHEAAHDA